jgi:hypothetical protein
MKCTTCGAEEEEKEVTKSVKKHPATRRSALFFSLSQTEPLKS